MLRRSEFVYLSFLLILILALFWFNSRIDGSIKNPESLAVELESPLHSPQDWGLQTWPVFKFRLLFKWIVKGTWQILFPQGGAIWFYRVYLFYSILFFYATIVTFYLLLKMLNFSSLFSFVGCLLFLASPAVALAYLYPVHTREDPLAYFLVLLGILAIIKSRSLWISAFSVIGQLVRETTLILLAVYLLLSRDSLRKKILVCLPVFLLILFLRIFFSGAGMVCYISNPFTWSKHNIQYPLETVAFLFLTFGFLWLPALVRLKEMWLEGLPSSYAWKGLIRSAPIALIFILGTCLVLARPREMRISFLAFPWVIPFTLDWFRVNIKCLKGVVTQRLYWVYTIVILSLLFLLHNYIFASFYDKFWLKYWLITSFIHLSITLVIVLPLCLRSKGCLLAKNKTAQVGQLQ